MFGLGFDSCYFGMQSGSIFVLIKESLRQKQNLTHPPTGGFINLIIQGQNVPAENYLKDIRWHITINLVLESTSRAGLILLGIIFGSQT